MATKLSRPRGIYDRGSSWQVKIKRKDANGRRHAITRTFPYDGGAPAYSPHSRSSALQKAEAFAATERAALRFEKRPTSSIPKGQTLDMLLTAYADKVLGSMYDDPEKKAQRKTFRRERSVIRRLREVAPALLATPLLDLKGDDFRGTGDITMQPPFSLTAMLAAPPEPDGPLKPQSIVRYLTFLSGVFAWAVESNGMHDLPNPLHGLTGPFAKDERKQRISADEWQAILTALAGIAPPIVAAIKFLRATGARRGETLALRWEDIDWKTDPPIAWLRDETVKNGEGRALPLLDAAVQALEALRIDGEWPTSGQVFDVHPDSVTHAWVHACERAMLADLREHGKKKAKLKALATARLHDLRHTRVTEITKQMPIQRAMKLTGHKTVRMLLRYYNETPEEVARDLREKERAARAAATAE